MAVFGFKTPQTPRPRSIALVASDAAFLKILESYAAKATFESILPFASNEALDQSDKTSAVDVIVLDWDGDGTLSTLALYNRLRRAPSHAITPILAISARVVPEDFRLLREYPASGLLAKPLVFASFQEEIKQLWAERHWYLGNTELMKEIFTAIEENPREVAKELPRVMRSSPNPIPLMILSGRMLADKNRLADAEAVFRRVLQADEANVAALNELGKILYRVGRHAEALETLRACKRLAPHNMERLCLMGQVELTEADPQGARRHFQDALAIDGADPLARAGLKLADNVEEFFARSNGAISVTRNFASLMNTIGITKVRSGAIDEGIEQYKAALPFIGDDVTRAKILFNLGLGNLRKKDFPGAMSWFQQSLEKGGEAFAKSHKYVALVANALRKYGAPKEAVAEPSETAAQELTRSLVQGIEELGALSNVSPAEGQAEGQAAEDVGMSETNDSTTKSDDELTALMPPPADAA